MPNSGGAAVGPFHAPRRPRILVVDDNEDGATLLTELLVERGHEAYAAFDAPGALRLAAEVKPAAAFLDIGLPLMNGYELGARLRSLPGLADLRLVAVTGYGQASDRQRSQQAGFYRHLVKPVDVEAVEAAMAFGPDDHRAPGDDERGGP